MGKYAIILVLSLSFSVFAYTYGIRSTGYTSDARKSEVFNQGQAKNIAQSMAQVVLSKIMDPDDNEFNPQSGSTISFPQNTSSYQPWNQMMGEFRFEVSNLGDSLLVVRTDGMSGNQHYNVEVVLQMGSGSGSKWSPQFPTAVFAGERFELTGSARILGSAGTNSIAANSVILNSWAWPNSIEQKLYIGPGGNPSQVVSSVNNNSVGDAIEVLASARDYPMPDFPAYPPKNQFGSNIHLSGNSALTLYPADFHGKYIPNIQIQSNTTLTINLGNNDLVLHVGDLDVSQGHINLVGNGTLTVFVENEFSLGGSSSLNATGDVDQLFMFYGGTNSISLTGSTQFKGGIFAETASLAFGGSNSIFGHVITGGASLTISGAAQAHSRVIYAPNAIVEMNGSGQVSGAIVSRQFKGVGNIRVFYNEQYNSELPDLTISTGGGDGPAFAIRSWN
jgi:hypothetical protein